MSSKDALLQRLSDDVFEMDDEDVVDACQEYIDGGYEALDGIMEGLVDGMGRAGKMYEEEEYFVSDILLCADAMYAGVDMLKPHLEQDLTADEKTAVIGVIEGDTHDIGKNLVKTMLETGGYKVVDLGKDVPLKQFVDSVESGHADVLCMSTLMTTTMDGMGTVVNMLKERGLRDKVKVMIGGAPITQIFADKIGADTFSPNAVDAVKQADKLTGRK